MRWCLLILAIILSGCGGQVATATALPFVGSRGRVISSPTGRFSAQLWFYNHFGVADGGISEFEITDTQTGIVHRQAIIDVLPRLHSSYGGGSFQWTPSDNYIVMVASSMVSVHGCYDLFVYAGDGSALVHTLDMSSCASIMADWSVRLIDVCDNDDIIFAIQYGEVSRLSPATGEVVEQAQC